MTGDNVCSLALVDFDGDENQEVENFYIISSMSLVLLNKFVLFDMIFMMNIL